MVKGALSSMMDCMIHARVKPYVSGDVYCWYGLTKGWVFKVVEKGSDWLGSYAAPHTMEVWTGKYARLVTRIRSLMGKAAHLCRV